jgi:hypothetical protein
MLILHWIGEPERHPPGAGKRGDDPVERPSTRRLHQARQVGLAKRQAKRAGGARKR